jgi:hypothetical protein
MNEQNKEVFIIDSNTLITSYNAYYSFEQIDHIDSGIIQNYGRVISHIQSCGLYTSTAFNAWSQEQVADPWIVAAAITNRYTVISLEVPIHGLNINQKSNKLKIPNICDQLNVKCQNLYYMMNNLAIKL